MKRSATTGPGGALRVLVVDDDLDVIEIVAEMVRTIGHEVREARDGKAALALSEEFQPDVVLLDLSMPDTCGCELAQELRHRAGAREIDIVSLSGWDREDVPQHRGGFDAHLTKPVGMAELRRLLGTPA